MSNCADIDDDYNWTDGFYELAIELGPRDDARLERGLASIWRHAARRPDIGHLIPGNGSVTYEAGDRSLLSPRPS
jgi:hypothetical protein